MYNSTHKTKQMKTTTAIDFLKSKSKKRQLQEMQELKDLIILASDDFLTEDKFLRFHYSGMREDSVQSIF